MLSKLAILFLCAMALILFIFGRPKKGDRVWPLIGRRRRRDDEDRR